MLCIYSIFAAVVAAPPQRRTRCHHTDFYCLALRSASCFSAVVVAILYCRLLHVAVAALVSISFFQPNITILPFCTLLVCTQRTKILAID